jgi:Transglycosylase SLT domain
MAVLAFKDKGLSVIEQENVQLSNSNKNISDAPSRSNVIVRTLAKDCLLTIKSLSFAIFLLFATPTKALLRYLICYPLHAIFIATLFVALSISITAGFRIHRLASTTSVTDLTISQLIEASSFGRNFSAEELKKNGVKAFVGAGAPEWVQRESIQVILSEARKEGFSIEDQAVLLAIANIESGFNPFAQAQITTACGLFQFVQRTGEIFALSQDECMDPLKNTLAQIEHYQSNFDKRVKDKIKDLAGTERLLRNFELSYYLHHDGPNSDNPSNELKALVLSGSHFLLKSYDILKKEEELSEKKPSYAKMLKDHFLEIFNFNVA